MALLVRQWGKAVGRGKSRGVKVIAQQSQASMVVASGEEPQEIEKGNGVGTKGALNEHKNETQTMRKCSWAPQSPSKP
jgi:hypothetical protein